MRERLWKSLRFKELSGDVDLYTKTEEGLLLATLVSLHGQTHHGRL